MRARRPNPDEIAVFITGFVLGVAAVLVVSLGLWALTT